MSARVPVVTASISIALAVTALACDQNHGSTTSSSAPPARSSAGATPHEGIHWMQAPAGLTDALPAIRDTMASATQYSRMAQAAREDYRQRLNWDRFGERLSDTITALV